VDRPDPVRDDRDARRVLAPVEAAALAAQERGCRRVGDGGDAGVEQRGGERARRRGGAACRCGGTFAGGVRRRGRATGRGAVRRDRGGQLALVAAAGAAGEARVREVVRLERGQHVGGGAVELHGGEPRVEQRAGVGGR
jgi:hypothetical protein